MTSSKNLLAEAFARVPAYRAFLNARGAGPDTPWEAVPLTTKKDYLLVNEAADLCWDGTIEGCHIIGASSGFSRSGTVFWPKRPQDEGAYAEAIEHMLSERFAIGQRRTLVFVCLAFGTWFGGMQLATAMRTLAASGRYPLTVALPGVNLGEAVEIYRRFAGACEQVLWITNPSNVSLIAALLERGGITPPPGSVSFPVIGEYFPEAFREHVAARFGHPIDAPFCIFTGYGSADAGGLGDETEATIALRKHIFHRPELSEALFGTAGTPMLLQPMPGVLLECIDGRIAVTKDSRHPADPLRHWRRGRALSPRAARRGSRPAGRGRGGAAGDGALRLRAGQRRHRVLRYQPDDPGHQPPFSLAAAGVRLRRSVRGQALQP